MISQAEFDRLTTQSEKMISAKVLADSINPDGCRLITMEWTYPRMIHSEIMTHRKLSRNSASSRAIPLEAMIKRVVETPMFPLHWGRAQSGMQAERELEPFEKLQAATEWLAARDNAVDSAWKLRRIGIHKQIGNRILEPWMWITIIASATNLENLFALRCHKDAEPHFQNLAYKVRAIYDASQPRQVAWGEWHLPLFGFEGDGEIKPDDRSKISVGRCARVSYLTHEGIRDPSKDIELYDRLAVQNPLHASPLEHAAVATQTWEYTDNGGKEQINIDWGNFDPGWLQFRKSHPGENVTERTR